tara:strand:- start:157 stop:336 length:180 start_codon:yes stop_codon:yes gene_type:complete
MPEPYIFSRNIIMTIYENKKTYKDNKNTINKPITLKDKIEGWKIIDRDNFIKFSWPWIV